MLCSERHSPPATNHRMAPREPVACVVSDIAQSTHEIGPSDQVVLTTFVADLPELPTQPTHQAIVTDLGLERAEAPTAKESPGLWTVRRPVLLRLKPIRVSSESEPIRTRQARDYWMACLGLDSQSPR